VRKDKKKEKLKGNKKNKKMEEVSEKDIEVAEEIYSKLKLYCDFHGLNLLSEKNIPGLIALAHNSCNQTSAT